MYFTLFSVHFYTVTDSNEIYEIIETRRAKLGLSQAEVSMRAFNRNDSSAIQNIKRGSLPSFSKLSAISNVLGLECYFGAPREFLAPDPHHPSPGDVKMGDDEFTLVDRYDVNVSAGAGLIPTSEEADGKMAFSRSWLLKHQINAQLSGLVKVKGDSMEPTIADGSLALVHMAELHPIKNKVYACSLDGQAIIKRLIPVKDAKDNLQSIVIVSDNPHYESNILTNPSQEDFRIIGRVRCILSTI